MKLATLRNGERDGALVVVRRDNERYALATHIAPSLQAALDTWDAVESSLQTLARELESGAVAGEPLDISWLDAPLPRAYEWVDGSAYLNHVRLVRQARNAEPPKTLETDPLVYQGGSGVLLGPTDPLVLPDRVVQERVMAPEEREAHLQVVVARPVLRWLAAPPQLVAIRSRPRPRA